MKTNLRQAILLLVFCFSFLPLIAPLIKHSQALDLGGVSSVQEWTTDQTIDKQLTIAEGETLIVRSGITLTFDRGNIDVQGKMVISGTSNKPVILKRAEGASAYSINVFTGGSLIARNADISGAGMRMFLMQNNFFINTAYASSFQGGINIRGGSLDAQACSFHDNEVAISADAGSARRVVVNRSKFFNNSKVDVFFDGAVNRSADFRYNWWGNPTGPKETCEEAGSQRYCYYEKISDDIDFSNWLSVENFHDPVLIIPGIFGSQKEAGTWKIDPVFHVYDNLIDEFKNNGYVVGKDLFVFPYEWRDSNVENAIKLKYKIAEIKTITNWPKVDVVAHSMGGLLTRQYIQSNDYQKDVDQLITLGTPNKGAPEIYPLWEAGQSIGAVQTGMRKFLEQEMEEAGYASMFKYIRERPIFSAKELLPTYAYLYDLEAKKMLAYPEDYPINDFLDNLNNPVAVEKLNQVEYTKIIGKTLSDKSTISKFEVMKPDLGELWKHGYPLGFEIPMLGDRGAKSDYGDGTVPLFSAQSEEVLADKYLELNSLHADLPTKAQKDVLEILTGIRPVSEVTDSIVKNMLQFFVHSPIDIQIIAPDGKRIGKNYETGEIFNEIPGAFYSGYDTENEFVTIPNPEDGDYEILTQGTGDGQFRVDATKISQDPLDPGQAIESTASFTGAAETGKAGQFDVQVAGDVVMDKNKQVDPPTEPDPTPVPTSTPDPVTSPVIPPAAISQEISATSQAQVAQTSSKHKKKKHKKKKKNKKTTTKKVAVQKKKVVSVAKTITKNKATKQASAVSRAFSSVTKSAATILNKAASTASSLKNFFSNPFKYFK
ncbi:MAG: hypothetical protein WCF93_01835 [Candidatus Moraniibacteriota bacterium]